MKISYVKDTNNFHIETSFYELNIVRGLPKRNFNSKMNLWVAPALRLNVLYLQGLISDYKEKSPSLFLRYSIEITKEAEEKIIDILAEKDVVRTPFPVGYAFKTEPRSFQKNALDYTYSLKKCFFNMATGSGKTKTAIDKVVCHYIEEDIDRVLVVCPCTVRLVWEHELDKHTVVKYIAAIGGIDTAENKKKYQAMMGSDKNTLKFLIVGTESFQSSKKVPNIVTDFLKGNNAAVIVDEGHDIKNVSSIRFKTLNNLCKNVMYKIIMTGTPISNNILDLYGMYTFLDPSIIGAGDFYSFKNRYCCFKTISVGASGRQVKIITDYQRIEELMELIRPFTFTVTKEEAAKEIPSKTYMLKYITMSPEQKALYTKIKKEGLITIGNNTEEQVIPSVLAILTSLQQIAGGNLNSLTGQYDQMGIPLKKWVPVISSEKNPKIMEIKNTIDAIEETEQIIIWAKYRYECELLVKELNSYKTSHFEKGAVAFLDLDDVSKKEVVEAIGNKKIRYFISTPNSGGVGLTLNSVCYVFYYSNNYRLLLREQSEDRNHRIGQTRPVFYYDFITQDTVDTMILDSLKQKKDLSVYVRNILKEGKDVF